MSISQGIGPVNKSVGYVLKQAATALRSSMDAVLRPLDLTISQYACLEVLDQQPGLSSSELARATFVTRQSMNLVLQGLLQRGLLTRPTVAEKGKTLPAQITDVGRKRLREASIAVHKVEVRMIGQLTPHEQDTFRDRLASCVAALTDESSQPN